MGKFIPTPPEISSSFGNYLLRQDLTNYSVTIYLKDWSLWDADTEQVPISSTLIHFIQPEDGQIVGIKVFGDEN